MLIKENENVLLIYIISATQSEDFNEVMLVAQGHIE